MAVPVPESTTTALITNDAVVLGLLAITLGVAFWTASRPSGFWHRFYSYVPDLACMGLQDRRSQGFALSFLNRGIAQLP